MRQIVVIANDMRSALNVGSLLRTAEGLGVSKVYLTGYTPYPKSDADERLPHIADKLDKQISKTALGAEKLVDWETRQDLPGLLSEIKTNGYSLLALEQSSDSINLNDLVPEPNIALLLGTEVTGIPKELQALCDNTVEIPMLGSKESFNVVQAAAMTLYHLQFR